jgi:hypothetical protein
MHESFPQNPFVTKNKPETVKDKPKRKENREHGSECVEILPAEKEEITKAKELLAKYSSFTAEYYFRYTSPHDPKVIPGFEQVQRAIDILRFYDLMGEKLFVKSASLLSVWELPSFVNDCLSLMIPRKIADEIASTDDFNFKYILVGNLNALMNFISEFETPNQKLASAEAALHSPSSWEEEQTVVEKSDLELKSYYGKKILEMKVDDYDEADFHINPDIETYLPESLNADDASDFIKAVEQVDGEAVKGIIEKAGGIDVEDEKIKKAIAKLILEIVIWKGEMRERNEDYTKKELPASAGVFDVYHAQFNRTRSIDAFTEILMKKMAPCILGYVIDFLKGIKQDSDVETLRERLRLKLEMLHASARSIYRDVARRGVPIFRELAQYLTEHAKSGEFHVGRDTYTTTFVASNALHWGAMTAAERLKVIKHVDVSRRLAGNTTRAV